ncbi:MAG: DUF5671 domain-containing protein [Patescibacteria group bacterium]|nr:hypothetical protein [Patescibacteria group bacterium]
MSNKPPSARSTAKDVFSYLLMIIMLYVGVVFFITLLWQYINVQFPDPLEFYYTQSASLIRNAISALLIVWPVFLLISWSINRDLLADKIKESIWVRKWLLYLTLFAAAITIIVDLISLTNSFLGGELTTRFVLKVIAILVVAIAVLWFYLWELRRDVVKKTNGHKIGAIISSLLIVGWIVAGFFIVGTPNQQRAIRFDEQRVYDLQSIQGEVISYWIQKEALPANLDTLKNSITGYVAPLDPISATPYVYTVKSNLEFLLCASFATDTAATSLATGYKDRAMVYPYGYGGGQNSWDHGIGRVCFTRTIDPELYRDKSQVPQVY